MKSLVIPLRQRGVGPRGCAEETGSAVRVMVPAGRVVPVAEAGAMAEVAVVVEATAMMETIEIAKSAEYNRPAKREKATASPEPTGLPPTPRCGRNPVRTPAVIIIRSHIVIR